MTSESNEISSNSFLDNENNKLTNIDNELNNNLSELNEPSEIDDDNDEIDTISSKNVENDLLDDLYILKSSLISKNKLNKKAKSYLNQILNIINEYPQLSKSLYKWKFLEKELIYCLRSKLFGISLKIIKIVLEEVKEVPDFYLTKKFLFFMTEYFYFSLGGKRVLKSKNNEFNPSDKSYLINNNLQNNDLKFYDSSLDNNTNIRDHSIQGNTKLIINIFEIIININPIVTNILYDLGVFDICNNLICLESLNLFNTVFKDKYYNSNKQYFNELCKKDIMNEPSKLNLINEPKDIIDSKTNSNLISDINKINSLVVSNKIYEIHRKFFSPEVIFKEKSIFNFKTLNFIYKNDIYELIYNQFTNIKQFADLNIKNSINFLLYKKIIFMNEDLELLILSENNKNILLKFLRFYRRSLEKGQIVNEQFLRLFYKLLDEEIFCREIVLILFYYENLDFKVFSENRIRNIFRTLEYSCEMDCVCFKNNMKDLQDDLRTIKDYKKYNNNKGVGLGRSDITFNSDIDDINNLYKFCNKPDLSNSDMKELDNLINISIDNSYISTNDIFGQAEEDSKFDIPCDIINKKGNKKMSSNKYTNQDFDNLLGDEELQNSHINNDIFNLHEYTCERLKIIKFIKKLYQNVKKEYFYKPTFLILLRFNLTHCFEEKNFILKFFSDFLLFLNKNNKNIAGCLFPDKIKDKKIKMVEYKLSDDEKLEELLKFNDKEYKEETVFNDSEELGIKRRKNVVD